MLFRSVDADLDGVLLQVEVACVDGDALGDLVQVLSGADDPAGLVGAGAVTGAGRGRLHALRAQEEAPQEQLSQ